MDGGPYRLAEGHGDRTCLSTRPAMRTAPHTIIAGRPIAPETERPRRSRSRWTTSRTTSRRPRCAREPHIRSHGKRCVDGGGNGLGRHRRTTVEVSVDGGPYRLAQGTGSWSFSLDTTAYADGSHTLTAKASDAAGRSSTTSTSVVVRQPPRPSTRARLLLPPSSGGERLVTPEG